MIFLNGLFGYLSVLIIVKWCTGSKADLYHVMIYMFLSPTDDLGENELFANQKTVQVRFHRVMLLQLMYLTIYTYQLIQIVPLTACVATTIPNCRTMDAAT